MSRRRAFTLLGAGVIALAVVVLAVSAFSPRVRAGSSPEAGGDAARPGTGPEDAPLVARGPFRRTLVLNGRLTTAAAERLRVPILPGWRTTLKWMIDEGTRVEPGEIVVRLDTSSQASNIAATESALLEKRQGRELKVVEARRTRLEAELRVAQAQLEFETAKIDAAVPPDTMEARRYQEFQLALERAKSKLEDAGRALAAARDREKTELQKIDLEIAGLEEEMARAQQAIDDMTLRASTAGIVVHDEHPWFGRKLRVGENVQSTFPLVRIPDLSTLEVEAFSPESEAGLLRAGQKVTLWLDAFPSREFTGVVAEASQRGEERPEWGRSYFFRAKIALDAPDPEIMRPGMSARCEIVVDERDDALLVPLVAAELEGGTIRVRPRGRDAVELRAPLFGEMVLAVAPDHPGLSAGDVLEVARARR